MVNLTHERRPMKHAALVVLVGTATVLAVLSLPNRRAIAAVSLRDKTVGNLKAEVSLTMGLADTVWTFLTSGAVHGAVSAGLSCKQEFSVGELLAYLRFTAKDTQTVAEALSQFWSGRGCTVGGDAGAYWKGWSEGLTEGWDAAVNSAASDLLRLRETEDTSWLEKIVQSADAAGADALTKAKGVVAGARLLELKRRGGQAPVWRPPVPEKK